MAETAARDSEPTPADLKTIRAAMAQTRTTLEQKLDELKSRFSDARPASGKRTTTMAKKKTAASKPQGKKKTPAKSSTSRKPAKSTAKPVRAVKKTVGKVAKKTKEVLGDMLAGAAVGAVKGAAEAVVPPKKGVK